MMTDPISDLLTRIRNAAKARHARVDVPASKLKTEVVRILKEEGFIQTYKLVEESKTRKVLRIFLKYSSDGSAAHLETRQAAVRRLGRAAQRDWRFGNQHRDHASRRDDGPSRTQGECRRRSALRSLVEARRRKNLCRGSEE
jgi:ribosomal protein S8